MTRLEEILEVHANAKKAFESIKGSSSDNDRRRVKYATLMEKLKHEAIALGHQWK